jgi:hypothetical protein
VRIIARFNVLSWEIFTSVSAARQHHRRKRLRRQPTPHEEAPFPIRERYGRDWGEAISSATAGSRPRGGASRGCARLPVGGQPVGDGTLVAQSRYMAATLALGKIICFRCRRSDCAGSTTCSAAPRKPQLALDARRAIAWLGGACVAGGVFGAGVALLLGG